MNFDPQTKLGSLLTAIPSAASVLNVYRIAVIGNQQRTVDELCIEHGVAFEAFLKELNGLNWDEEYCPQQNSVGGPVNAEEMSAEGDSPTRGRQDPPSD